ncbi:phasin family protein [Jhaorihella thermophila]
MSRLASNLLREAKLFRILVSIVRLSWPGRVECPESARQTHPTNASAARSHRSITASCRRRWRRFRRCHGWGAEWAGAAGRMSGEFLQFMADRVKEDVRFQHSCLQCKSPQELQKLQAEFIQKAIDQYVAETGKKWLKSGLRR